MNHSVASDLLLPHAKFAYNNFMNCSTRCSPFEVVKSLQPHTLVSLVLLPCQLEFVKGL